MVTVQVCPETESQPDQKSKWLPWELPDAVGVDNSSRREVVSAETWRAAGAVDRSWLAGYPPIRRVKPVFLVDDHRQSVYRAGLLAGDGDLIRAVRLGLVADAQRARELGALVAWRSAHRVQAAAGIQLVLLAPARQPGR